jgi:hypothetical protein
MKMAKDFTSNEWVHLGCLIRKMNARSRLGTSEMRSVASVKQLPTPAAATRPW